jgi:hypothetical protein
MVGAETRAGRGVKWITENYIWTGGDGILSGGLRIYGERLSADIALFAPIGVPELMVLPLVNVVWTF